MKATLSVTTVGVISAILAIADASAQSPAAKAAANYPTKPVRIVIPYPPGGTSDILARLIGTKLHEIWGHPVVVENRSGAAGTLGVEFASRAAPDGYTFVLTDIGNLAIAPSVYKLSFDPLRDLQPVTVVSYSPHLLTVHPSLPVKTTAELVNLAKANPGKLNVPTGLGSAGHFAGLAIEQRTGARFHFIGTRGGSDSSRMVMTGECEVLILGMLQTIPHVKSGRLKLIAVSSDKRIPALPNTPTIAEGPGLGGFVSGSWQGVMTPSKVPPEIVAKVNADMARVLQMPDIKEKLNAQGTDPVANSPQDAGKWFAAEHARAAKLVKDTGFKLQ
ncbi:MAG: tripartite tricarboxylate transporter substrate binding protein [Betaproteobacteria bacterium]|nr:MAG: tripartite tricarboxylate transporter substrate binding protein [Betaproteobacteria bacterium]